MVIQLKPVVVVDSAKLRFIKSYTSTHNDRPPRGGFSDLDIVNKAERRCNRVLESKARFSKIFNSHTFLKGDAGTRIIHQRLTCVSG